MALRVCSTLHPAPAAAAASNTLMCDPLLARSFALCYALCAFIEFGAIGTHTCRSNAVSECSVQFLSYVLV